jgi:hypothetical protein
MVAKISALAYEKTNFSACCPDIKYVELKYCYTTAFIDLCPSLLLERV